jgi:hypothetical protein
LKKPILTLLQFRHEQRGAAFMIRMQAGSRQTPRALVSRLPYGNGLWEGVVDGLASCDAACHAGGPGLIPGPGQTYV